jgi:hypothetical protein
VIQTHDLSGDLLPDILEKNNDLHPSADIDINNSQDDDINDKTDQITVDTNVLSTVITSLPRLSCSGLIGWTKELISFL